MRVESSHIAAAAIEKSYRKGQHKIPVLRGVNIEAQKGEFLSIIGQSGSGKSTLLHLLGLLDTPDVGEILLDGQRLDDLPGRTRDQLRNRVFGFIFQFYHLLPELSLLENVLAPLMIRYSAWEFWKRRREFRERASEIIALVGLEHRLKHKPSRNVRRRNAAGRHRPGPCRPAAKSCWPTSRPVISTRAPARKSPNSSPASTSGSN